MNSNMTLAQFSRKFNEKGIAAYLKHEQWHTGAKTLSDWMSMTDAKVAKFVFVGFYRGYWSQHNRLNACADGPALCSLFNQLALVWDAEAKTNNWPDSLKNPWRKAIAS